jgi:hypothetical protein
MLEGAAAGMRQHPRAAQQMGGDDRNAAGVQAPTLDVGAVDAEHGGGAGPEDAADRLRLPADGRQGPV